MGHEYIRYVPDLGMYAFSRGRNTCLWQTPWCKKHCYMGKFEQMGWSKSEWDELDNKWWLESAPEAIVAEIIRVAGNDGTPPTRFRFSVKGEIWNSAEDVEKVRQILLQMPDTLFWIPTRAWHDWRMSEHIEYSIFPLPNARVSASVDPTDNISEVQVARDMVWSLMFTGDNDPAEQTMLTENGLDEKWTKDMYRCPKTWQDAKGHCALCTEGCFRKERTEVHLKKHR